MVYFPERRPDGTWVAEYVRIKMKAVDGLPHVFEPAQLEWREVTKVAHYYLSVNAMTRPMQVREDSPMYGRHKS
jgi:hypothetical protein